MTQNQLSTCSFNAKVIRSTEIASLLLRKNVSNPDTLPAADGVCHKTNVALLNNVGNGLTKRKRVAYAMFTVSLLYSDGPLWALVSFMVM